MKITFLAYSDEKDFSTAVTDYQTIWDEFGHRITSSWEKRTGMTFRAANMNAFVWNGISHAPPLCLRDDYEPYRKRSVLTHELGHCLMNRFFKKRSSLEVHKALYLILYDILIELYGQEYADGTVEEDGKWSPMYKEAWSYALSYPTEAERNTKFAELKKEATL